MVSVGVSALETTSIHFIESGVKVNGQYYREDLLMHKLLPDIRHLSDFYVFRQDSAPVVYICVARYNEYVNFRMKMSLRFIHFTFI